MLGAAIISFPYTIDPNAGNEWTIYDPEAVNNLPLRSQPLYGGSIQYATDALKPTGISGTTIILLAVAAIAGLKAFG